MKAAKRECNRSNIHQGDERRRMYGFLGLTGEMDSFFVLLLNASVVSVRSPFVIRLHVRGYSLYVL